MDSLTGLLDGPRARGAFVLRSSLDPPWAMSIRDEAPLSIVVVVRGRAVLTPSVGGPERLNPGDVAIVTGPRHYTVADDVDTAIQVVIHPGQRCTTPEGEELTMMSQLGVRSWGNNRDGSTVMVTGTYEESSAISHRLLNALPELVVVRADTWDSRLLSYLSEEVTRDEPGQEAVLDRLLDLLVIAVLRVWFSRPDGHPPGWYAAQGDPVVGAALRLIHDAPARPWTVATLARATGVSRAALARRFNDLVGEPPMTYLTGWRIALAADLIREPSTTVESVARQVGYGNGFALSTAFKRVRGVSPREHRAAG